MKNILILLAFILFASCASQNELAKYDDDGIYLTNKKAKEHIYFIDENSVQQEEYFLDYDYFVHPSERNRLLYNTRYNNQTHLNYNVIPITAAYSFFGPFYTMRRSFYDPWWSPWVWDPWNPWYRWYRWRMWGGFGLWHTWTPWTPYGYWTVGYTHHTQFGYHFSNQIEYGNINHSTRPSGLSGSSFRNPRYQTENKFPERRGVERRPQTRENTTPQRNNSRITTPQRNNSRITTPQRSSPRITTPQRSSPRTTTPQRNNSRMTTPQRSNPRMSSPNRSVPQRDYSPTRR